MQGCQIYHIGVPIVLKSESLKLLPSSRTVPACTAMACYVSYLTKANLNNKISTVVCYLCNIDSTVTAFTNPKFIPLQYQCYQQQGLLETGVYLYHKQQRLLYYKIMSMLNQTLGNNNKICLFVCIRSRPKPFVSCRSNIIFQEF